MGRVVILGIDGATFSLLDPLIEGGPLPNLARLLREGSRGPLRSTIHPLTPAAWTSCVTGVNPGKHGVFDFRRRRAGSYELELVNARQRDGQPLWDILSAQGRRAGVFNVPMTYPPTPVNGFMVAGMDTPGLETAFTFPASLRSDLFAAVPEYAIDVDAQTNDELTLLARIEALAVAQQRALDVLIGQYPDLDLLMAVLVATDRLYHTFWRYLDPAQPAVVGGIPAEARAVHERIWAGIDECVAHLRAWAGDGATFMLVSDHGFGALEKDVYINRFLLDAGWLRFGARQGNIPFAQAIDWEHTQAYSFGYFGNINVNLRGREPLGCVEQGRQAEDLKSEISAALLTLCDPETGERMVDRVRRREDLYWGPHVDDAPDLLLVMRDYAYMTRDGYEGRREQLVAAPMLYGGNHLVHTGNHRLDGVFAIAGPGVQANSQIGGASILDIAPTALYALGAPAPALMDGHVLRQAYTEEHLRQQPPRRLAGAPPPVQSSSQRQLLALAKELSELRARLQDVEAVNVKAADYAAGLERTVAEKNAHISELERTLGQREADLAAYQRSIFLRAYQRLKKRGGND